MTRTNSFRAIAGLAVFAGTIALTGWATMATAQFGPRAFKVPPKFSELALEGQKAFDANCASCHGRFGIGTDKGPPFIHTTYNPGHHDDGAFFRAVADGVRQHHWRFGDMPAQPKVSPDQVRAIVRYVRELQQANGITYQPHRM